jgi:hypothetical protein
MSEKEQENALLKRNSGQVEPSGLLSAGEDGLLSQR